MSKRQLAGLKTASLYRLYRKLSRRLGDGGWYGWDWATLNTVRPGMARAIRALCLELSRRGE